MDSAYNIQLEKLSIDEVYNHLFESADDFASQSQQAMEEYAEKLANHASFVTMRDFQGILTGIIAFYANNSKFAFISHVWIAEYCRGGGYCGKLLYVVNEECKKLNIPLIKLEVRNNNKAAIAAYQKFGFVITSKGDNKSTMEKIND